MTASSPVAAGRIFISYRREDSAYPAGWLFDRLVEHFGRHQVFKDVDSIQLGDDFAEVIGAAVAKCDVLLVLIGHRWLTSTGVDRDRRLYDPKDFVRLEIESALTRGVRVIPVLIEGAQMPLAAELPPSLAGLVRRQALELSPSRFDFDTGQLLRVLDQSITEVRAPQAIPARPPRPAQQRPAQQRPAQRRRVRARTVGLAAGGIIVAAIVALVVLIPGGGSAKAPSPNRASSSHLAATSSNPAATSKVILTDNFSNKETNWVDDYHPKEGTYTGTAYRLSVTGANGQGELARPSGAAHGLSDVTPLNLSASVDARKIAGAAQGYGYGIAFRDDGHGDLYAFVIQDHAVAIQKWVGGGARVADNPAPVPTGAVHTDAADRLQAVCVAADGGRAVHLELWLNGKRLVDFTDRDHPYTKGYLGLYVVSLSDATSTASAEFDNFTAAQL